MIELEVRSAAIVEVRHRVPVDLTYLVGHGPVEERGPSLTLQPAQHVLSRGRQPVRVHAPGRQYDSRPRGCNGRGELDRMVGVPDHEHIVVVDVLGHRVDVDPRPAGGRNRRLPLTEDLPIGDETRPRPVLLFVGGDHDGRLIGVDLDDVLSVADVKLVLANQLGERHRVLLLDDTNQTNARPQRRDRDRQPARGPSDDHQLVAARAHGRSIARPITETPSPTGSSATSTRGSSRTCSLNRRRATVLSDWSVSSMTLPSHKHVVDQDQPGDREARHELFEVVDVLGLVGIDERQVDRHVVRKSPQRVERRAYAHLDVVGHAGLGPGRPADVGPLLGSVTADEPSVGRHGPGHGQRRVAGERPDLDGQLGLQCGGEDAHEGPLERPDLHVGLSPEVGGGADQLLLHPIGRGRVIGCVCGDRRVEKPDASGHTVRLGATVPSPVSWWLIRVTEIDPGRSWCR